LPLEINTIVITSKDKHYMIVFTKLILFSLLKAVGYVASVHIIQIYNIPFQIQIEEKVNLDSGFSSSFMMKKKCWITRFN